MINLSSNLMRFITILIAISILLSANNLADRYPNYKNIFKQLDIPQSYINNPQFVKFVTDNEKLFSSFYKNSVNRGKRYIPLFKDLLNQKGLSHLFVYMSMTESGFQTYAKSPKQAAGLWQFMSATAKRFNLRVNQDIDERYDPVASTEAATRYIRFLYSMFGKWYLVMMAYNCGEGCVQRAIKRVGTDEFEVLMRDDNATIPAETRRYIKKILLLSMMGEKIRVSKKGSAKKIKEHILPDTETLVNIYGGITLERLARLLGENPGVLYRLNPQIKGGVIPPSVSITQIFIPTDKLARFRAFYQPPTLKEIFKKRGYKRLVAHIVKKGETLKSISQKYRVTELDLIITNELKSDRLYNGEILMIPITEREYSKRLNRVIDSY